MLTLNSDPTFSMFASMIRSSRFLLSALVLLCTVTLSSQPTSEAGLFAGGTYNIHSASFTKLGTYPSCCPEFTGGSGFAWYAGGWYGWHLSPSMRLLGRLSASSESGLLSDQEPSVVADLRDTARIVNALFQHDLRASLMSIGIEPLLTYRIGGSLEVMAGARAALVVTRMFRQTETLVEPADYGSYLGDDRVWVDTEAEIPQAASLRLTAVAGLRYRMPVGRGRSSFIAPELSLHVPLSGVASDVSWNVTQLRLGVALGWDMSPDADTVQPVRQQQPPPPPPPVIAFTPPSVRIALVGRDVDGSVLTTPTVRVEQTQVTTLHPVLGHVYFDAGQSFIPERYQRGIERAQRDTLRLQPREALHAELYVIAQRMLRTPSATITCTGTTSGTVGDQGLALARARAETVRDVLISLGVPAQRIDVQARTTPQKMTTASDTSESKLAIEENRRVEITSTTPSIFAPLTLGSADIDVTPSSYRITSSVTAALPVAASAVELRQGRRLIVRNDRPKVPDDTLDLDLTEDDIASLTDEPLIATITAKDSLGQIAEARAQLNVEVSSVSKGRIENLGTTQIERYQLILFDFNDVTVTGANARLLTLIRSRITPTTQVRIIGATDVMGSREYNADLSLRRAREVARQLQVGAPTIVGSGEQDARFDNALPEGRAYNRTVIVELINAVK